VLDERLLAEVGHVLVLRSSGKKPGAGADEEAKPGGQSGRLSGSFAIDTAFAGLLEDSWLTPPNGSPGDELPDGFTLSLELEAAPRPPKGKQR
jgi:hypothetical protein